MPKSYLSIIALFLPFFTVSCSEEAINNSPERTAHAFLQAASEGNIDTMQSLAVQEIHDDEALSWLVNRLDTVSSTDLTLQGGEMGSLDDRLSVYTVYAGSAPFATLYVTPIGNLYFIMRVYPPDSGF